MATPVFAFWNQEEPGESLFWIHDTRMELPWCIPVDFTTFIYLHFDFGRTLSGLIYCWEDLKRTGSSLDDWGVEAFHAADMLRAVKQHHEDARMPEITQQHLACSSELLRLMDRAHAEDMSEDELIPLMEEHLWADSNVLKDGHYYLSLSHLYWWLYDRFPDFIDELDLVNDPPRVFLQYAYQIDTEKPTPELFTIPHRLRSTGYFRAQCILTGKTDLIPGGLEEPWDDRQMVLDLIRYSDAFTDFKRLSDRLKEDPEIIEGALRHDPNVLDLLSPAAFENRDLRWAIRTAHESRGEDPSQLYDWAVPDPDDDLPF